MPPAPRGSAARFSCAIDAAPTRCLLDSFNPMENQRRGLGWLQISPASLLGVRKSSSEHMDSSEGISTYIYIFLSVYKEE